MGKGADPVGRGAGDAGVRGPGNPGTEKGCITYGHLHRRVQRQININTRRKKSCVSWKNELSLKTKAWRSKGSGIHEECQNQAETKALASPGCRQGSRGGTGSVSLSPQPDHMLGYLWPPQTGVPRLQGTRTQSRHDPGHEQTALAATRQRVPAGLLDTLDFKTAPKALKFPPLYYICIYCARSIPSRKVCSILFFICF